MDSRTAAAELSSAMVEEANRRAVDEMKKRAIVTATSYDEFKGLVACATLKPLGRDDLAKRAEVSSNRAAGRTVAVDDDVLADAAAVARRVAARSGVAGSTRPPSDTTAVPAETVDRVSAARSGVAAVAAPRPAPRAPTLTLRDVERAWRKLDSIGSKQEYLRSLLPTQLRTAMRVDVDAGILGDMLHVMQAMMEDGSEASADRAARVARLMEAVSSGGSFSVCTHMLSDEERRVARGILDALDAVLVEEEWRGTRETLRRQWRL